MTVFLIGLLASVPLWFLWRQAPRECPHCHSVLSMYIVPWRKTRRQWIKGGFVCPACKIEVDLHGEQVAPDEPPLSTAAFLRVLVPALLAPVLIVGVSYGVFCWGKEWILQQAMAAEFDTEPLPIARRPAPLANTFDADREKILARIVLHEHGLVHGGDLYSFGVELENQSLGSTAWVEFDAQDVKLEFTDESGQNVPRSSVERSGPTLPVCQALIPPAGYTVFSTYDQGMGIVSGQKRFNAGYDAWHLKPGKYLITGSIQARIAFTQKAWQENEALVKDQPKLKLTIPTVEIVVAK